MITINTCVYCESMGDDSIKKVVLWKQTGELVCYECRVDLLDQEFVEPFQKDILEGLERNKIKSYLDNGGEPELLDLHKHMSKSPMPVEF